MSKARYECRCGKIYKQERAYLKHLAEKNAVCYPIPKTQKKILSICPRCKKRFYYWQNASIHSTKFKHYGDYSV